MWPRPNAQTHPVILNTPLRNIPAPPCPPCPALLPPPPQVKPPVGLSTPMIFKSLDLARRSTADPRQLLAAIQEAGAVDQGTCVNDLEQPAFDK